MIKTLFTKIFGSRNARVLKSMQKTVERINELEHNVTRLQDNEFPQKTIELRSRWDQGESLDDLLPEAFALVREAGRRTLDMRHFDVQLVGGIVLNRGNIAEMRTGEGKTLVATLPAYLNALTGSGVHIITVNDYLAQRDAEWMGAIYSFMGMTTGVIVSGLNNDERKRAYAADITYGTNNEFGFDYLRDNMKFHGDDQVQRDLKFAIVDEVDSILIDEARTPLIISGSVDDRSDLYLSMNRIVPRLKLQKEEEDGGDYVLDEKSKQAYLTETGHERVEKLLLENGIMQRGMSLYDPVNIPILHHMSSALRAHSLFQNNVDYIVQNNEVVIVDEFTGRTMPGRRWSDGLHQAIEAKENVPVQNENQTLATITYQNYFRLYEKLAGMTGTADTEAYEFQQIYGLEVVVVPTHLPMVRDDQPDMVYLTSREKFAAIIDDIKSCQENGQPVLVGTVTIEVSEYLSGQLKKNKIKHQVLNAKYHEREAEIIAQAGRPGTVTIATNMAGRGTDIVLGGNLDAEIKSMGDADEAAVNKVRAAWQKRHQSVVDNGGLRIVGTERHESRRIDNQLRGRSGRQGDPGSSRFYISLEDDLMRIFASERVASIMQRLGMEEGEAIESTMVTRAIENAQRKVEAHNFDIRKHLLEYDDVANDQRKVIYEWRNELLGGDDVSTDIRTMREDVVTGIFANHIPPGSQDEMWNTADLADALANDLNVHLPIQEWLDEDTSLDEEALTAKVTGSVAEEVETRHADLPPDLVRRVEKGLMLDTLDRHWKEHLVAMDHLRQGIGLRGYAAKNPKQEYKKEAFSMFGDMLENIKYDVVTILAKIQVREDQDAQVLQRRPRPAEMQFNHPDAPSAMDKPGENQQQKPYIRNQKKIGRNEPCPCGSGKKFKFCHGKLN
ncbi:MAG: preprotein translocase subunit SecA [Gammaproteobacteria bacterium]|nr:preprotein translocase subunit SecA [Gammaproteobacteria bacterium]